MKNWIYWRLGKYQNYLHLQSIGLDNVDIAASKFKIKIRWKVDSEGKSYKMDVAGIFTPSILHFVCEFLRPMTE